MRLMSAARSKKRLLAVQKVFRDPVLSDLTRKRTLVTKENREYPVTSQWTRYRAKSLDLTTSLDEPALEIDFLTASSLLNEEK